MENEVINEGGVSPITKRGLIVMLIAAILSFAIYKILPYEDNVNKGLGLLVFIAILWLTEAVHITVTALMIPLLGIFIGIGSVNADGVFKALTIKQALSNFANPTIFLFFGGFALATALHIQKLDTKIAMKLISLSGSKLGYAAIAICLVTAGLSMWISNTATAAMMLPLAIGMLSGLDRVKDKGTIVFVLLGIAYSASIGGLGTMVGSPPNAIVSAELGLTFFDWMKIGLPLTIIMLPVMLLILYFLFKPDFNKKIEVDASVDIPWTTNRILTIIVFCTTALCWIFAKPLTHLTGIAFSDGLIALGAAVAVVVLGLCTWNDVAKNTEWGVLMLFGGGLTLSAILKDSGASLVLGQAVANIFGGSSPLVIIFVVAIFIIILTEFTSNTASAALLVPVFAGVATQMGMPKEILVTVIGVGASCAFMLPVATPPNALVFGTGMFGQKDMIKAGIFLNIFSVIIIALFAYFIF
ncbi:SLC13 family permease [Campylobacter ureolyticus]|uniref:DASS family sodium-coupled anion symporter n=1 Tax=Campylobacter ureolyticus TaxID=827 RepID=A0A9Q4PT61_9BACT|nr:DASS family sodium-coupled anion symporter [Campylobacter ureolyticus]MCZ6159489.1 DASS family sodium-coupled anion symporter [Campylobacter ureolyticus]MCZ6163606.1 DASS family sodium-coupled anion symporter [Campylobacter ureolyticus]MCZ6165312.1 DASS family sodium-coupled anion symporter [Campylobacter ureolyticus]